jgi:cysteine-rich repeat protein
VERVEVAICGNSVRERGETCDDGNTADGDGCDSNCTPTRCGNGVVTAGETCDDGNTDRGDGCSATCQLECGNGVRDGQEQCDDGNTTSGDGCEADCTLPRPVTCGNGVIDDGETCDDGNSRAGDGCSSRCQLECGDGRRSGSEQCDDGNRVSGDGCSATCVRECVDPSLCSDGDACTTDACVDGHCTNEPLAGRPGILCAIKKLIDDPPCQGEPVAPKLRLKLRQLLKLLNRTDDVANPQPIAQRAQRLRTTTQAKAERMASRDKLTPSCAAELAAWLIQLQDLLEQLRGS